MATTTPAHTPVVYEVSPFWKRRAYGPQRTPDLIGVKKAMFHIFWGDLNTLWPSVKEATEEGYLGYYSGFSDDGKVISIHVANAYDRKRLAEVGVFIRYELGAHIGEVAFSDPKDSYESHGWTKLAMDENVIFCDDFDVI